MKLLHMKVENTQIFGDAVEVDFTTADRVRRAPSENDNVIHAFHLKGTIYSQVLWALAGLNASGKTTMLQLISLILRVIFDGFSINHQDFRAILAKVMKNNADNSDKEDMRWIVHFVMGDKIYQLESTVSLRKEMIGDGSVQMGAAFYFRDEKLSWKPFSKTSKSDLLDFSGVTRNIIYQAKEREKTYFNDEISIVYGIRPLELKGKTFIYSTLPLNDMNWPGWIGPTEQKILQCFDPNIETLSTNVVDGDRFQFYVQFKNQGHAECGGDIQNLGQFLSSGTIKGVTLLKNIVAALSCGGYVLVDEVENHFNKKLVEWIFSIFEDKRTNPLGACLVFSTHYPELLDYFKRNDNIYITRKVQGTSELVRYSSAVTRKELLKSKVLLYNVITGTAPRFDDIREANLWIAGVVNQQIHVSGNHGGRDV